MSKKNKAGPAAGPPAAAAAPAPAGGAKKTSNVVSSTASSSASLPLVGPALPPSPTSSSSPASSQRTIQVKIGSQAAKSMTPDQAAEYLKQSFASAAAAAAGKGGGGFGALFGGAREVKMTFSNASSTSPSKSAKTPPSSSNCSTAATSSSTKASSTRTASSATSPSSRSGSVTTTAMFSSSKGTSSTTPTSNSTSAARRSNTNSSNSYKHKSVKEGGMPCSEKEMKALMSMFVEIMGLQMNTEKLNATKPRSSTKSNNGGERSKKYHDSWEETDSLPDLEDAATTSAQSSQTSASSSNSTQASSSSPSALFRIPTSAKGIEQPVTGLIGIDVLDWDSLERVAIEDALEQEERARKTHSRHKDYLASTTTSSTNKSSSKSTAPPFFYHNSPTAELFASTAAAFSSNIATGRNSSSSSAAAASGSGTMLGSSNDRTVTQQRHQKAIQAWKTQVVTSMTQGTSTKQLVQLLKASPLQYYGPDATSTPASAKNSSGSSSKTGNKKTLVNRTEQDELLGLEQLIPHCVVNTKKNRKRKEYCDILLQWMSTTCPHLLLSISIRNGRSVFHNACWEGNIEGVKTILQGLVATNASDDITTNPQFQKELSITCSDSGWTPLQYACLSGYWECMELLLEHSDCTSITNPTLSWQDGDTGLTTRQLLEAILVACPNASSSSDRSSKTGSSKSRKGTEGTSTVFTLETHGMALDEIKKKLCNSREYRVTLEHMVERLLDVEQRGYTRLSSEEITHKVDVIREQARQVNNAKKEDDTDADSRRSSDVQIAPEDSTPEDEGDDTSQLATFAHSSPKNKKHPSSSSSTSSQDPMIAALVGMGFAEEQIMSGITASGGVHRATADEVVAWIFGQQETNEPSGIRAPASKDPGKSSTTSPPTPVKPTPTRSNKAPPPSKSKAKARGTKASDGTRQEASRAVVEDPIAAEQQAAKREEQRRRNREWNNRAQVRQQQEVQAMLSKVSAVDKKPRDTSTALPSPAASYFPQPPPGPPAIPRLRSAPASSSQSTSPKPCDGPYYSYHGNDAGTIASSIDVEFGNDDATVSTLGSFQTRATPVPAPAPIGIHPPKLTQQPIPPGFNQPLPMPHEVSPGSQSDQLLQMPSLDMRLGGRSSSQVLPSSTLIPPPGIPESNPFVDEATGLTPAGFATSHNSFSLSQRVPTSAPSMTMPLAGLSTGGAYSQQRFDTGALQSNGLPPGSMFQGISHGHDQRILDSALPTGAAPGSYGAAPPALTTGLATTVPSATLSRSLYGDHTPRLVTAQDTLGGSTSRFLNSGILGDPNGHRHVLYGYAHREVHPSPAPVPQMPMASGYGPRMQSAPANLSAAMPSLSRAPGASISQAAPSSLQGPVGFTFSDPPGVGPSQLLHHHGPQQQQQQQQQQHLDSSIIDSISTGSTVLPGASLWSDRSRGTKSSGGSSLLLGNLIQSDSAMDSDGNPSPMRGTFLNDATRKDPSLWATHGTGSFPPSGGESIW